MNDLMSWIRTQLDTDERIARKASWFTYDQVQAHRAILDLHQPTYGGGMAERCDECQPDTWTSGHPTYPCRTVKALASIYADRDGYRAEWSA